MPDNQVLVRHFLLMKRIISHYNMRKVHPPELEKALSYCREQIALAPQAADVLRTTRWTKLPAHTGVEILASIREEGDAYAEAIALCTEGKVIWGGEIERYKVKVVQQDSNAAATRPPVAPPAPCSYGV